MIQYVFDAENDKKPAERFYKLSRFGNNFLKNNPFNRLDAGYKMVVFCQK
jgi:hypothetical protein